MVGTEQPNESWHVWMVPDSYILHRLPALPFDEHTRHAIGFQGYLCHLGMVCLLYPCPTSGPSTRSAPACHIAPRALEASQIPRFQGCVPVPVPEANTIESRQAMRPACSQPTPGAPTPRRQLLHMYPAQCPPVATTISRFREAYLGI